MLPEPEHRATPSLSSDAISDPYVEALFFAESEEMVQMLEQDLLALEQAPVAEVAKRFRQLLRAAHSLKGSAWMFELGEVAQAAHHLEDSLTLCQSQWPLVSPTERHQWLSDWLQVVDGLAQVLQASRHRLPSSDNKEWSSAEMKGREKAVETLHRSVQRLPVSQVGETKPQAPPSLHVTILSTELPPLLENLAVACDLPPDPQIVRAAIPDLLEHLQELNGMVRMLKLADLQVPIDRMETLAAQALIEDDGLETLPHRWTEQLIAIEEARLAVIATPSVPSEMTEAMEREPNLEPGSGSSVTPGDLSRRSDPEPIFLAPETEDATISPFSSGDGLRLISKVDARRVDAVVALVEELLIQKTVLAHHRQDLNRLTRGTKRILQGLRQSRHQLRRSVDHLDTAGGPLFQRGMEDLDALEWDRYSQLHEAAHDLLEHSALLLETIEGLVQLERGLDQIGDQFGRLCSDLSEHSSRLRRASFSQAVDHLPRSVRELSQTYGKPVDLMLYGRTVEIDAQVLRQLQDPLSHLVRNAFDHGIESGPERQAAGKPITGRIEIAAVHQGSYTVVTVRDDGRGINLEGIRRKAVEMGYCPSDQAQSLTTAELYRLLFKPGFSTSDRVSEISGRGVGLDIVEAAITRLQGQIGLQSQPGQGTVFTLKLPLALSILPILLVRADRDVVAIPQDQVQQITRLPLECGSQDTILWQDHQLPLLKLPELLTYQVPHAETPSLNPLTLETCRLPVLILQNLQGDAVVGLAVDQLLGHQEIVLKPLPPVLPKPLGIRGASVLGTGQVTMVLDTEELIGNYRSVLETRSRLLSTNAGSVGDTRQVAAHGRVLVVDDSYSMRQMLVMTLSRQGYQVDQAQDGQAAIAQLTADSGYQVILTDLEMPRLDGFGLLRHLQTHAQLARIPAIVLTSRRADKHRARAESLGAAAYLTKPFRRQELLELVDRLLHASIQA